MNRVIQGRLFQIAAGVIILQAVIITLSPVVRERTWDTSLLWTHWFAVLAWCVTILLIHRESTKRLPDVDPFLLPVASLLSGWGILTIWRLEPDFGARQTFWFVISMLLIIAGMRLQSVKFLQRYKYLLLVSGLSLTALTLLFGTNPSGFGPRLWLGCCDVYFQPSEPLKLLLVIYLAAYFSDRLPYRLRTIHILYPIMILGGIVIMLLLAQRDLGTASIFLALYTIITYLATNRRSFVMISVLALIIVGIAGYYFVDIVQYRIETWINPWNDPQGGSYQVIQSLIAIANGGVEGRGPGLGNPGLVPVAISDFVYAAIAEETGLFGTLGLLALIGILCTRGIHIALRAPDLFRRLLAGGISAYLGTQSILIVGGNIRLLPLTGVTLPLVSYGGSSLLTSFAALLILLLISNHMDEEPAPLEIPTPYFALNGFILLGLFASALATGWWAVIRGPDLLLRTDNIRRIIEERYVPRGSILDRYNSPITVTAGTTGSYTRNYVYPDLAPVVGYDHPRYGQAGLERVLDGYLRGLSGNPAATIWLNHLLYGTSPHGLDMRLSIDLNLQIHADELLTGQSGAIILMDANTGEILAMASHHTFNANLLDETASDLLTDPQKPLINRATLGIYPTDSILEPFARALFDKTELNGTEWASVYNTFGLLQSPALRIDIAQPSSTGEDFYVSPLQMAVASAALTNGGTLPAPRIAIAVNTPNDGWVVLPAERKSVEVSPPAGLSDAVLSYIQGRNNYWSFTQQARDNETTVTWFIGGTFPNWQASPLTVVVLLEEGTRSYAARIGGEMLSDAMTP